MTGQCGGEEWIKKETEDGFAPKMQAAGYEVAHKLTPRMTSSPILL